MRRDGPPAGGRHRQRRRRKHSVCPSKVRGMLNYKTASILLFIAIIIMGVTSTAARKGYDQSPNKEKPPKKTQQMVEAEERLPVAEYAASEPTDPQEREKRVIKGKKFDNPEYYDLTLNPTSDVTTMFTHWASGLSDIPTDRSSAIVVGDVTHAKAFLTPSKKRVYSEFMVNVTEVLKDDTTQPIKSNHLMAVNRVGGRVRFPGGKTGQYFIVGQNMPVAGGRYIFFLTPLEETGYSVLTGYELRDGRVYLLDNPGMGHPITSRQGLDETSFLNAVRAAVAAQ